MALTTQQICSARHTLDCTTKNFGSSVALHRHSWLRSTGLSEENKTRIEELPFEREGLLHPTMDDLMEDHQKKQTTAKCLSLIHKLNCGPFVTNGKDLPINQIINISRGEKSKSTPPRSSKHRDGRQRPDF
ncbi:hypothetical protein JRQ81_000287 [Phrynocephalus forsythii]|uniref:Uncharacterized protein n=1 Tax=Phrynocephalus forsythii TaxID=171643 RepID=A0A9Q0Y659_9SAUR|nr:hypothetical protein JRQ81_000287 [Phrynocephalus forsythii]